MLRFGHQGDGLQHVKAADGTAGQMHLGPAFHGSSLDIGIEIKVCKGTDGDDDEVHTLFQHGDGHGAHGFDGSGLHDVLRLQCQQGVHIVADGAAHGGSSLFGRSAGAAGDAHQLIVRQQAVLPCVGHDVAQKAAAHDAKFCFHIRILNSFFLLFPKKAAYSLKKYTIEAGKMI